jgi:hypothetical protein
MSFDQRVRRTPALVLVACVLFGFIAVPSSRAQVEEHPAVWFNRGHQAFFLFLNGDGSRLLANRSTSTGGEEVSDVPVAGGATRVWLRSAKREIFDRIAFSGDGAHVAYAPGSGSRVYFLANPGAPARLVADVSPASDPRQLTLSRDGGWVAFTASSIQGGGRLGRPQVDLYVAATDGSVLHRITSASLPGKHMAFALSGDGGTMVWVDDPARGPLIANRDGQQSRRLPPPLGGIYTVSCSPDGGRIHCMSGKSDALQLCAISRLGTSWAVQATATSGRFIVAPSSGAAYHLERPTRAAPGTCSMFSGPTSRSPVFRFDSPRYAGSIAISDDGRVAVWRDGGKTMVWRKPQ